MTNNKTLRLIDANLNRLKEGIRVVEDIFRYNYDNKEIALKLKSLRHLCRVDNYIEVLSTRDVNNDVLRESIKSEQNRSELDRMLVGKAGTEVTELFTYNG